MTKIYNQNFFRKVYQVFSRISSKEKWKILIKMVLKQEKSIQQEKKKQQQRIRLNVI
jgi:DNA-binding transcriptional regulator PaaX